MISNFNSSKELWGKGEYACLAEEKSKGTKGISQPILVALLFCIVIILPFKNYMTLITNITSNNQYVIFWGGLPWSPTNIYKLTSTFRA